MNGGSRLVRALLVGIGVVGGLALAGIAGWLWLVRPAFERAIFRATGWKADVAALQPGWRRLVARNVVLLGAPPFQQTPLAKIGRLEVELSGSLWSPRPAVVSIDGAVITYLAVGLGKDAVDNFRGVATKSITPHGLGTHGRETPTLRLSRSRFEGFLRLDGRAGDGEGPRHGSLSIRCEQVEAIRERDGSLNARWEGVVVDLLGAITARVPRLALGRRGGATTLSARDLSVVVPGAGSLLNAETIEIAIANTRATIDLKAGRPIADRGAPATSPGTIAGKIEMTWGQDRGRTGVDPQGDLILRALPMTALAPLLQRVGLSVAGGTANLELQLRTPTATPGALEGSLSATVDGLDIHHPRLDRAPWKGVSLAFEGTGTFQSPQRRLELSEGTVTALGVSMGVAGWLASKPAWAGELRISPPPKTAKACAEAFATWPASLRARLAGLVVSGRLGATGRLRFDERTWDDLELGLEFSPICKVVTEPTAIANLVEGKSPPASPETVTLRALPAHVVGAFLTAEDGGFRRHDGFDLEMIRRALAHDLAMGTLSKGASTLSQQVAKNLFLGPERTIARKLAELVLTWRLEEVVGKDRILELYLNIVELGPNLRGLGPASLRYFGKPASALSPLEAAHLASLLPNPVGFARRFREGRVDAGWLHKLYDLLGRMQRSGFLTEAAVVSARSETLSLRKP